MPSVLIEMATTTSMRLDSTKMVMARLNTYDDDIEDDDEGEEEGD